MIPPQGKEWTKSLVYNLRLRLSHITPRPHNARNHDDNQVRERILELRARGHTARQIASILNEQGWIPLKGRCFTERNIHGLHRTSDATKVLTPKRYLRMMLTKMERVHDAENPGEPFAPPSLAELARFLTEAGYKTPRGKDKWWPAQIQQVMEGRFEGYYASQKMPFVEAEL